MTGEHRSPSRRLRRDGVVVVAFALLGTAGCADDAAPTEEASESADPSQPDPVLSVDPDNPPPLVWSLAEDAFWPDLRQYPGVGPGRIVVTNKLDDTVSLLDLSKVGSDELTEMATVPVGLVPVEKEGPTAVVADPLGEHYYVALNKNLLRSDSAPGGHGINVARGNALKIRASDNVVVGQARIDRAPGDIRMTPDGGKLLVSHLDLLRVYDGLLSDDASGELDSSLAIIDPSTMQVDAMVPICPGSNGIAVSADGSTAYVTCLDDHIVEVDLESPEHLVTRIPVIADPGPATLPTCYPYALTMEPSEDGVWVSCFESTELLRFDRATGRMDPSVRFRTGGPTGFGVFTSDGSTLFVPHQQRHDVPLSGVADLGQGVAVVDAASGTMIDDIPLPETECDHPRAVAFADAERRLLVLCEGSHSQPGTILVVDVETRRLERSAEVGHFASGMTLLRSASPGATEENVAPPTPLDHVHEGATDRPHVPAVDYGELLFSSSSFSRSGVNVFSCSTCHSASPSPDGPRVAFDLHNTAFRESWWGGAAPRLLDAVNFCMTYFMRDAPLDPTDANGRALYEYLVHISPERDLPALPMRFVEATRELPPGDPAVGEVAYGRHCSLCHGAPYTDGPIPTIPAIPNSLIEWAEEEADEAGIDSYPVGPLIVDKVRHGQFYGVGGNMPFFTPEVLSNEDLAAIVTYLGF